MYYGKCEKVKAPEKKRRQQLVGVGGGDTRENPSGYAGKQKGGPLLISVRGMWTACIGYGISGMGEQQRPQPVKSFKKSGKRTMVASYDCLK